MIDKRVGISRLAARLLLPFLIAIGNLVASASDHADPIVLQYLGRPESNLTGLFVFEHADHLVIAMCARPGLADDPVRLSGMTFTIHIDHQAAVRYHCNQNEDEGRTFRYGGWITSPEAIESRIQLQFDFRPRENWKLFQSVAAGNDIGVKPTVIVNHSDIKQEPIQEQLRSFVGLRDDPFILYPFYSTNVVAMVVEIPLALFGDADDFLVWGTASRYGKQKDHVGRALRTMLPRLDFLNQLHPREHVAAIKRRHEAPGPVPDIQRFLISPLFAIRHYDFEPDVVIFNPARWRDSLNQGVGGAADINDKTVAFPNGRRLTDDVARLMIERGDCLLFEVSTSAAHEDGKAHPSENNKPFESQFPYLAAPNENPVPAERPKLRWATWWALAVVAVIVLAAFLLPWWLWYRVRRKWHNALIQLRALSA